MTGPPVAVIPASERTPGGSLPVRTFDWAARVLDDGGGELGFVLLPSDTAYSLAVLPRSEQSRIDVNQILDRGGEPVSLAFASAGMVRDYIGHQVVVDTILAKFCPGPITVVCKPTGRERSKLPPPFFSRGIAALDGTIGVRIPDSIVERDLAATVGMPITTVAVREKGEVVTDFRRAIEIVSHGMRRIKRKAPWLAIEDDGRFYAHHSTVVRISRGHLELLRTGDIAFAEIERLLSVLPVTAFEVH